MRLIDADALVKDLLEQIPLAENVPIFKEIIESQPTAYEVDKVLEQLENERKFWENAYDSDLGKEKARSYEHAIEIVKAGGKIYGKVD